MPGKISAPGTRFLSRTFDMGNCIGHVETSSQELKQENADHWAGDNTSIYVALGQWLKFTSCWIIMFWWCGAKGRLGKHDSRWQTTVTNIDMLTLPYLSALLILLVPKFKSSPVLLFVYHWVRCCRMVLSKPIEKFGPSEHKLRMEMTLALYQGPHLTFWKNIFQQKPRHTAQGLCESLSPKSSSRSRSQR